ncbi:MAG: tetratricopeptide repeat protein [Sphingomonas sp.]
MVRNLLTLCAAPILFAASPAAAQSSAPADAMAGMHHGFPQTLADWSHGAQLFEGLGDFHRPAGTLSKEAQAYFDQGMRFLWAFNHDEATRSFARAAEVDPACAMCFWGVALTLGPNYNMPMMAEARARVGFDAIRRAQALSAKAAPADQAMIAALAKRFDGAKALDPSNGGPLLLAFANGMREAARRFPGDADVQVLFAESMMNLNPWKLWNADGSPAPGTPEIVSTLESVLASTPGHPGANHYYIHAVEASRDPGKAIASAERVGGAMPAAGHLVHMPSHILQRVGRYSESAEANRLAAKADAAYYAKTAAIDYYPMYSAHNYQFLAAAAAMEGRGAETVKALRDVRGTLSDDMVAGMPGIDWTIAFLYESLLRFGMWDAMLAEPAPDPRLTGMVIGYRSARTIAFAAKGRIADATAELARTEQAVAAAPADAAAGMNVAKPLYAIAVLRAKARIALARRADAEAVGLLIQAVAKEDALSYNEPADEFFPTRHLLGAALLDAGEPHEAEAVYREDLKRNPANGWALLGLAQALEKLNRTDEAATMREQFETAWAKADTRIARSAF